MGTSIAKQRQRDGGKERRRDGLTANSLRLPSLRPPAPRAAYLHVPFCRHRCGYCNFTLVAGRDDLFDAFERAIGLELASHGEPREVDTLFFGGGTPTHLGSQRLGRLIGQVRRWFPLAPGGELSVEANPADLDDAMLDALV